VTTILARSWIMCWNV